MNEKEGYIYVFKCIVGSHSDIIKIGKTIHFGDENDRLKQHGRTTYYGFVPYCDFTTGNPIATAFRVKDMDEAERLIKQHFKRYRLSTIEIFNIDYDDCIKELYDFLRESNLFIELIKDDISVYDFLGEKEDNDTIDTTKNAFRNVRQQLLAKYNNTLPDKLLLLLKDKKAFEENCVSHFRSGNYLDFPNDMILDLHYCKAKRIEILNKLQSLL